MQTTLSTDINYSDYTGYNNCIDYTVTIMNAVATLSTLTTPTALTTFTMQTTLSTDTSYMDYTALNTLH